MMMHKSQERQEQQRLDERARVRAGKPPCLGTITRSEHPRHQPNDTRKLHAQVLQMKVKSTIHVPAKVNQRYVSKRQAGPQHGWAAYEAHPGSLCTKPALPHTPDPSAQSIYPSGEATLLYPGSSATHEGGSGYTTAITTPSQASHPAELLSTTIDGRTSSLTSEADTTHSQA
ncbi:hypothetical protein H4Q26_014439 [Puccinia striiformis f. sp. tritici PST-130]|nr:hypothetical protein H4Q26_014439 [Puccinia striiformis f. sp. tritici PST-130]